MHHFQSFKDGFLLGRSSKKVKARANALTVELVKKQKVHEETNEETWMPSKMWGKMNAWWDYNSHGIHVSKEIDTNFNFPKIHLMSHWAKQIRQYGALQQYSAKRHEQVHKTNLKDGWNCYNHNLNYLPEVITFQRRILSFEIGERNHSSLAQHRENSSASCNILPSGADMAAPSVSNGSSFGPGQFNKSAWQLIYPTKNRQFFMRTTTLRPQIFNRGFGVWYVQYATPCGASYGGLRFSISSNLSQR